jgi:hypothetical protein
MRSRPAAIPQYLKSGRLAMFFLIFYVLLVPVVFSVAGYCGLLVRLVLDAFFLDDILYVLYT